MKFLIDENISPKVAEELQKLEYDAIHVREASLKGHIDEEIMTFAKNKGRVLLTLDIDFADIRNYPIGTHSGIIRLKIKSTRSKRILDCLKALLPEIMNYPLETGGLVVTNCMTYRVKLPKGI
jgi:predicted nuclease of predicted toxin-antitoxin system